MTLSRLTIGALVFTAAALTARPANEPLKREGQTLGDHTGTVRVLYAPDGTLATFSDDRTIQLRDAQGRVTHRLVGHQGLVIAASFSPDGKTLVTADGKAVRLWDVTKGRHGRRRGCPRGRSDSHSPPTARRWPASSIAARSGCGTLPPGR
jgi:WD40 repeat protein